MQKQKKNTRDLTFDQKTATNFIAGRTGFSKSDISFVLSKEPELLKESSETIVDAFRKICKEKYSMVVEAENSSEEDSSENEELEQAKIVSKIEQLFKENAALSVDKDILQFVTDIYLQTCQKLQTGKLCLRWLLMEENEQEEVLARLLEGIVAVMSHIIGSYLGVEKEKIIGGLDALKKVMAGRTIIIHGSYLFGAATRPPQDMDIIITNSMHKEALSIKLTRELTNDKLTIGSKYGAVDIMVGIGIWGLDDCTTLLWKDVAGDLKEYLESAKSEPDAGKKYRKLVNIAIILAHFKRGHMRYEDLKQAIKQANKFIVSSYPHSLTDLNKKLQILCEEVLFSK